MVTFLSGTASSNGTDFVSFLSLRSIFPFGMSGGFGSVFLAKSMELMFRCNL
jgi:hypothetical protein